MYTESPSLTMKDVRYILRWMIKGEAGRDDLTTDLVKDASNFVINIMAKIYISCLWPGRLLPSY